MLSLPGRSPVLPVGRTRLIGDSGSRVQSQLMAGSGISANGALHWGRRHLAHLEELQNGWALPKAGPANGYGYSQDTQLNMPRTLAYAFLAVERGDTGGLLHLHALVGNVSCLQPFCGERLAFTAEGRRCCMVHAWPYGWARVFPYDAERAAKYYVSKYVVKRLAEWELWGQIPPVRG